MKRIITAVIVVGAFLWVGAVGLLAFGLLFVGVCR